MKCEFQELYLIPSRNGLSKPSKIRGSGFKMINMGELFANDFIYDIPMERVPLSDSEKNTAKVATGDLLFARQSLVESGAGKCSIVVETSDLTVFESHIIRVRLDTCKANPLFYYYYFKSPYSPMKQIVQTGVQSGIKASDLAKLEVYCPCLNTQTRIASILKSIDDKIRTVKLINDNLVNLLQTYYQMLFCGACTVENQGKLSEICSYSQDRVLVSKIDIRTYFSTENMLPEKKGAIPASSLPTTPQTTACHKGDTLISNIRPYFRKIVYCQEECGCSTDVLCFTPNHPKYAAYLFSTLYADKFFDYMVAGSKGTKMPRGDKQQIMAYPVRLPSESELDDFNSVAFPILNQIHSNKSVNARLSSLRDTLISKLMSGEIDVSGIRL